MPKLKTHGGASKRIRVTGRGKLIRGRQLGGHLMEHKRGSRKRSLRQTREIGTQDAARIERLLPYR
ncbi:MAG TPA: 50S ribosomal protein L35 [bacterium]|nr:50S ribosomal protein L35 [bacterium]